MANKVTFSSDAISSLQAGVHKIFDAVRVTMGPKGRNVVIAKKYGGPQVTNDGVTIVKEIELQDQLENLGAQMIKEAATKTQDECGDGTTTAVCLAAGIVNEGIKMIAAGANPMGVKRGIEKAVEAVVVNLEKMTKQVTTREEIAQAATITSKDTDIGELIAEPLKLISGMGEKEKQDRVAELLSMVQLSPTLMRTYPHELTAGETSMSDYVFNHDGFGALSCLAGTDMTEEDAGMLVDLLEQSTAKLSAARLEHAVKEMAAACGMFD